LLVIVLAAIAAALISPYDPIKTNQRLSLEGPTLAHLMGTDRFGRDIFSRVVWGGQESLPIGLVSVGIGLLFGVSLGLVAGYYGGWLDATSMRLVDLLLAFPGILLALAIIAILGGSLTNLMIAVGISVIPDLVRLHCGPVVSLLPRGCVMAHAARRQSASRRFARRARSAHAGLTPGLVRNSAIRRPAPARPVLSHSPRTRAAV